MRERRELDNESKLYFINQLKDARLEALRDAEGYQKILHVIERMGAYLTGRMGALGQYEREITSIAERSPCATEIPKNNPAWHTHFSKLYELVRRARNDAMHQGVVARQLTHNLVIMALVLEDAMARHGKSAKITDFMVRDVVTAELWQPVSFVRQQMLINSFTHLPVFYSGEWQLISDYQIVRYLLADEGKERKDRLIHTVGKAIEQGLSIEKGHTINLTEGPNKELMDGGDLNEAPLEHIDEIIEKSAGRPILVTQGKKRLIGLITPFDML